MANRKKKPVIGSLQPDVDSMLDWNTLTNDDFAPASSEEKADFIQQRKSVSYWSEPGAACARTWWPWWLWASSCC